MTAHCGRARTAVSKVAALAAVLTAGACTSASHGSGPAANVCSDLVASPALVPPPVDADRPVMGFDPYNTFGTALDQAEVVGIVQAMARNGMRDAGYRYVILDDGWQGSRTAAGQITADPGRFPCGIQRLAAYRPRRGLPVRHLHQPGTTGVQRPHRQRGSRGRRRAHFRRAGASTTSSWTGAARTTRHRAPPRSPGPGGLPSMPQAGQLSLASTPAGPRPSAPGLA